jgi:hypothetical protein
MADFDLFGEPVARGHGRRGRPEHVATRENCNKIVLLLAQDWPLERVANALRITLPTLRKHYFSVLKERDIARDRVEARHIDLLWCQCEQGNVAALKAFRDLMDRTERASAAAKFMDADDDQPRQRKHQLGKKEVAAREAQRAGVDSVWGDDLIAGTAGVRIN